MPLPCALMQEIQAFIETFRCHRMKRRVKIFVFLFYTLPYKRVIYFQILEIFVFVAITFSITVFLIVTFWRYIHITCILSIIRAHFTIVSVICTIIPIIHISNITCGRFVILYSNHYTSLRLYYLKVNILIMCLITPIRSQIPLTFNIPIKVKVFFYCSSYTFSPSCCQSSRTSRVLFCSRTRWSNGINCEIVFKYIF